MAKGCLTLTGLFGLALVLERLALGERGMPLPWLAAALLAASLTLALGSVQGVAQALRRRNAPESEPSRWRDGESVRTGGRIEGAIAQAADLERALQHFERLGRQFDPCAGRGPVQAHEIAARLPRRHLGIDALDRGSQRPLQDREIQAGRGVHARGPARAHRRAAQRAAHERGARTSVHGGRRVRRHLPHSALRP